MPDDQPNSPEPTSVIIEGGWGGVIEVSHTNEGWTWRIANATGEPTQSGEKLLSAAGNTANDALRTLIMFLLATEHTVIDDLFGATVVWAESNRQALKQALDDLRSGS